ncbi:MAG: PorP/SprF family type IX secretion system membrane protein [Bacteroidia bacterium]|nr:PorP/SprF family type IX secretion system membrane protein [Bacteroidia bacterium]
MKQFFFILSIICASAQAISQNFTSYENCYVSSFIFNPAVAGTTDNLVAIFSVKKTWMNISQGPSTAMFNIYGKASDYGFSSPKKFISNITARNAFGLSLFSDKNGPLGTNGMQLAYAYQVPIDRQTCLSLGISAKLMQYRLDHNKLLPHDSGDPLIGTEMESIFSPNFNAGACLTGSDYNIGLSLTNLLKNDFRKRDFYYDEIIRTCYIEGIYGLKLGKSTSLCPVILVRIQGNNRVRLNTKLKFIYKDFFLVSAGWASGGSYTLTFAMIVKKYSFGYTYEYERSPLYSLIL